MEEKELQLYTDVALYHLFDKYRDQFRETIEQAHRGDNSSSDIGYWSEFRDDVKRYLAPPVVPLPWAFDPSHVLACFFQIQRAFFHVFYFIMGRSPAAARLRAAVWQSIFTHDLRRYQRSLYRHMDDVTTLITGPSGTGKELVARAIGLSRYVPFDTKKCRFDRSFTTTFAAINLSAFSPTLIESELFGHRRGAFTDAAADRVGWLEACPPYGSVFLDEIGELDAAIQVKLLRVLQSRTFHRLGDSENRQFLGKIVAATNRELVAEIDAGRFREDFYYRLCSDRIETPTLREQLDEAPEDLRHLLLFIARRVAPEDADALADEVVGWIEANMGADYPWPGNVRELEQCFRNVMIHGKYRPTGVVRRGKATSHLDWPAAEAGRLSADELLRGYCRLVYDQCRNYELAAQRLGLDRRTVKRKVETDE
jgi:DNA-binding NtrC family response regulator